MAGEGTATDFGVLDVSGGIDAAAQILGGGRDVDGGTARRASDHHPMEEVRDPRVLGRLETRAGADLQRHGDHGRRRILAHENAEPVGQRGSRHAGVVGVSRARTREKDEAHDEGAHHRAAGTKVTRT